MICQQKKTRNFQIKRRRSKHRNLKVLIKRIALNRIILHELDTAPQREFLEGRTTRT